MSNALYFISYFLQPKPVHSTLCNTIPLVSKKCLHSLMITVSLRWLLFKHTCKLRLHFDHLHTCCSFIFFTILSKTNWEHFIAVPSKLWRFEKSWRGVVHVYTVFSFPKTYMQLSLRTGPVLVIGKAFLVVNFQCGYLHFRQKVPLNSSACFQASYNPF